MKFNIRKHFVCIGAGILFAALAPSLARAQFVPPPPMGVSQTPDAQRNAVNDVRAQVGWLQNVLRTAPNYGTGGAGLVWQQFQSLRSSYVNFTMTLTPDQAAAGANELAELSAGLDILQESFTNYQNDVDSGRAPNAALRDLCQVLNQASAVWLQEFNKGRARLRVGR
jgi:hypothetical protein